LKGKNLPILTKTAKKVRFRNDVRYILSTKIHATMLSVPVTLHYAKKRGT